MRISVIVTTYQHENRIGRTLEAILHQTRRADEIVVIDDGSTDQTREILRPYLDRILYVFQPNTGGPTARNNGFQRSTGDLVLFCDADVVMKPIMLERLESTLALHPEASYAYCRFRWGWKRFRCRVFDASALRQRNFIHTSAALIRREHFPGFDVSLKKFQDWDVWLTMLERRHVGVFINEELYVVEQDHARRNISSWLPSFLYAVPWNVLPWKPKRIRRYDEAKAIIQAKHASREV